MTTTTSTRPATDILDPEWWRSDPQSTYEALLRYPGLWRDENSGIWLAARHGDVLAVERDPEMYSSRAHYRVEPSPGETTMISRDNPEHLTQRRNINRRFTPRAVASHADHYRKMVASMVDDAIEACHRDGSVEVVDALASQLPCRVVAELLGFPDSQWRDIKSWSERQMRIDRRFADPSVEADFLSSIQEWATVMADLLPQRSSNPADDLLTDWLTAGVDTPDMVQEAGLVIAGGAETTRTVIAHGLRALAEHPDQWEYLAADSARVPAAVEELLRWVTPISNMFRIVTGVGELNGTALAPGDRIAMLYPAANRDPRVFDEPETFDVTRDPNPHVSFGHGAHFCLGANLARLEVRLLLEEMTRRITNLTVVTEPDVEPNIFARAVRRFDLRFDER